MLLRIFNAFLNPRHLKLRITADEVSIMDEGSNDGTQLNGLLIPRKRLDI